MKDYIFEMRKKIGHDPLLCIGCGVIIENEAGEILLHQRTDDNTWGTPGGNMNFGETFIETAVREVCEETGLFIEELSLFGLYSGADTIVEFPNKDVCFGGIVVFKTNKFSGEILQKTDESSKIKFFSKEQLPENINKTNSKWIEQWKKGQESIYIG